MDPKLESDQNIDPPISQGASDYLPNPDSQPLDRSFAKWILGQLFNTLVRDPLLDVKWIFRELFWCLIVPWGVTGIAFAMLPHSIQEWLPGSFRILWWIIGGFIAFGALPFFNCGMSVPNDQPVNDQPIPDQTGTPSKLRPAETVRRMIQHVYLTGPRGGQYRIDDKGRKRYDRR